MSHKYEPLWNLKNHDEAMQIVWECLYCMTPEEAAETNAFKLMLHLELDTTDDMLVIRVDMAIDERSKH